MKSIKFVFAVFCLFCSRAFAQQDISLSALDLNNAWQEFGTVQNGKAVDGKPAMIAGRVYNNVVGVHAKSVIKVNLEKQSIRFSSKIAIAEITVNIKEGAISTIPLVDGTKLYFEQHDNIKQFLGVTGPSDTKIAKGAAYFIVKGDGKELYRSALVKGADEPLLIDLDVRNIAMLELIVDPAEDGPSGDHALWINPTFTYAGKIPYTVSVGAQTEGPKMTTEVSRLLKKKINQLPQMEGIRSEKTPYDWLIHPHNSKAEVYGEKDGKSITIANGMVSRTFRIFPNLATIDMTNRMLGEGLIRAVSSEGTIDIDGKRWNIGGLSGQPERGYLRQEWIDQMKTMPESFMVEDFQVGPLVTPIDWHKRRWALSDAPGTGKELVFTLRGEKELSDVVVKVYFAIYDHVPVIRKRMQVINNSTLPLNIDFFQLEYLAFSEPESLGGGDPSTYRLPNIHIESDYAGAGEFTEKETDITEKWVADPAYTSQRNYLLQTPCVLEVSPKMGPDQTVVPQGVFSSFSVYEMPFDSDDRERKGLFTRRMYRSIAPWTTENPIFMHLTSTDPKVVKTAIDQCDSTGYEMIILSFGSGLNAEDTSAANIAKYREFVDYAASKGIELGCYSLLASRWISEEVDVINPQTGKRGGMRFGSSPCLASDWGYSYFAKIKYFFEKTGMKCFEHDGSYPGDFCASEDHTHHKGLGDSQWNQFAKIKELYQWMSEQGIYMNVPDFYFLSGSNKVGIGYREVNWSLPRDRQIIHARQLNYDSTWDRIPSSVWSFVPLVEYQGGGAAATLEPLKDHLYEYEMHMIQNYGAGIQACYRGPRLYDTPQTKKLVTDVISWYKKYRNILNSDIIHLRKPDAKDWDGMMHVDPHGKEKGFALFYNPTSQDIVRTVKLPLYYTGLTQSAKIREKEGATSVHKLDRDYSVELTIKIPANGYTWYVIE